MTKKYTILVMVKHSEVFFSQTPEQEVESQRKINEFILSWAPDIIQTGGYHSCGLSEFDWFGTFETDDVSLWEAFREAYHREFHKRGIHRVEIIGVNHEEFIRATSRVPHYQKVRALGMLPGMAETKS